MRDLFNFDLPEISIDKPIRLIELFAGYSSQAMALKRIGADFEIWRTSEWLWQSNRSHLAVFHDNKCSDHSVGMTAEEVADALIAMGIPADEQKPMTREEIERKGEKWQRQIYNEFKENRNLGSIMNIHGDDLGICDTDKYFYMMTYSFPCFVADTLVLTDKGLKKIKDVAKGDFVLTHTNEYKEVVESKKTGTKQIWKIRGMGIDEINCTENHKFYVRKMYKKFPTYSNGKRGNERHFNTPEWVECKDLTKSHYLGIAINQNSKLPEWNGIEFVWTDGRKSRAKNELSRLIENHSFWWVIGRYVGDGWIRSQGGIIICCAKQELKEITIHLRNCNFNYFVTRERTVDKIHIPLKELESFVLGFGRGAENKKIPAFMFDMPTEYLESFIDGYLSADGSISKNEVYKISSVSRELIYGVAHLVAKTYKTPYRIYKTKRPPKCVIEGRICNQKDSFELIWKTEKKKQDKAFYENGYVWFPIQEVLKTENTESVYDIEVAENHSFTANGVIVHNCQDLSVAGKQKGMTKGSGTRSGLLWEVERILSELPKEKLPQLLFMENVPQVCGEQNQMDFNKWTAFLQKLGYTNYFEILNAKDYGVAQNRERAFMLSFIDEVYYEFPEPVKLEKRLKDYLEDKVDEKYYLNSEKAEKLISQLIESGELDAITTGGGTDYALTEQSTTLNGAKSRTALRQDTT